MMILVVFASLFIISPNDAKSHKSSGARKFGAERNKNEGVIDMDSLMDTHYPRLPMIHIANEEKLRPMKSKPQHKPKAPSRDFESVLLPETGTGDRVFGNLEHVHEPSSSSTEAVETEIPGVSLEPNTIPPVLRKLFLDHSSNVTKRGFLSNLNILHKSRKTQKNRDNISSSWADQSISKSLGSNVLTPKIIPPLLQSLKDIKVAHFKPFWKRSPRTRMDSFKLPTIETKPERKLLREPRKAQHEEMRKWEEWHSIRNPNIIQKRETNCRRMRISDIWSKTKKDNSSHEESVKIVLPLLLSDKDAKGGKKHNIVLYKRPESGNLHVPVSGTISTSSEGLTMKNFTIKGEDGKEYSFSASVSDVQQLLRLLAKPDSTLIMEKVSPERGKQYNDVSDCGPGKKVSAMPKPAGTSLHGSCNESSDIPELKEIETDVLENVLQADIPCNSSSITTASTTAGTARHSNPETSSTIDGATIVEFCDAD